MADIKSYGAASGLKTTSVADILNLINSFQGIGKAAEARFVNKRTALASQIDTANTSQEISNLSKIISDYDRDAKSMGYEEYALGNTYQDKKEAYAQSNIAYEDAKSIQDKNLGDEDVLYNEIMGMSWQQANSEVARLNGLVDRINTGTAYKHNYKPNGGYTATSLKNAIATRIGQIKNKINVFAENEGAFLVYKEDGTLDDVSQKIYNDLQFKILSGDIKDFDAYFDKTISHAATNFEKQEKLYLGWEQARQQHVNGDAIDLSNFDDDVAALIIDRLDKAKGAGLLDLGWLEERVRDSQIAGDKYNRQYEVLTGDEHTKKPVWEPSFAEEDDPSNISGLTITDPVNMTGTGGVDIPDVISLTEDEFSEIQNKINAGEIDEEQIATIEKTHNVSFTKPPETVDVSASDEHAEFQGNIWDEAMSDKDGNTNPYLFNQMMRKGLIPIFNEKGELVDKKEVSKEDLDLYRSFVGDTSERQLSARDLYIKYSPGYVEPEIDINKLETTELETDKLVTETTDVDTDDVSVGLPGKVLAATGTYLLLEDKLKAVGKYTKNQVIKGAKYIRATAQISGANIDRFMNDKKVQAALKEIGDMEDELKGLEKNSKRAKELTSKIARRTDVFAREFARKYQTKMANIKKLFNTKSRWSLFNLKADITTRFPKVAGKIFGTAGKVLGPFSTGSIIAESLGYDTWGEKIVAGTVTAAVAKKFWPQLVKIAKSPAGKKYLIKTLGKKAASKILVATVAGGGWLSLITGVAGTGLAAYDVYNAIKNWNE